MSYTRAARAISHPRCAKALAGALIALSGVVQAAPAQSTMHSRFVALAAARGMTDSARLHRLFDLDWEYQNVEYPESATFTGYPGQNDRWTDYSLPAIRRHRIEVRDRVPVLRAIARARLNPQDQLSYDLFRRDVEESLAAQRFPADLMAVTQRGGPQYLANTIASMPARTLEDYRNIVARLRGIPRVIADTRVLLDSGLVLGITPPRITLRDVPAQLDALVPDSALASPLLAPFTRMPATIRSTDREQLTQAAVRAYSEVRPAYLALGAYLRDRYIPGARESIARSSLPNGHAWYASDVREQTTLDRTPAEIHTLGLREVARIRSSMDSVIRVIGFRGSFSDFAAMLRTDPRFFYTDSATLVRAYRDIAKRIDPGLVRLFGTLPRLTYGVGTIPSWSAPSQTTAYYQQGSPDAGRPGTFAVNTYRLDARPIWEMEALTAHEAVPGHHLQIALAQELRDLPPFRRYAGYGAFQEGWALYAESLGPELGLYEDPYSKFGQLTYEMWRAIRLVIDTGIHEQGWSRDSAIAYFRANSAKTEQDIVSEVDRYIVWPGQALAYKSGELTIRELRANAERRLGSRFDIRRFHDAVLGEGALPLDVLSARMRQWIDREAASPR